MMDTGEVQLDQPVPATRMSAYDIFMVSMTVLALIGMALLLLPTFEQATKGIIYVLDFGLCLIFLGDFLRNLIFAADRRSYLLRWGWLDLLGSVPAMIMPAPWRLVRLARVVRIFYHAQKQGEVHRREEQRGESLLWVIILVSVIFIWLSSAVILIVEQSDPTVTPNIQTSSDALWWAIVTFATVGYGDKVPVTFGGRLFAVILMFLGIGLFSVLTGYITAAIFSQQAVATHHEDVATRESMEEIAQRLARIERLLAQSNDEEMIGD